MHVPLCKMHGTQACNNVSTWTLDNFARQHRAAWRHKHVDNLARQHRAAW
jgi:hypothetical protein